MSVWDKNFLRYFNQNEVVWKAEADMRSSVAEGTEAAWLWREHPRASGICSVLRTTSVEPQQTQAMAQGAGNTHKRGASSRAPLKRSTLIPRHEMPARPRKGLQDASDGSWSWPCPGPWALRSRVAITANSSSVSRLRCSVFSLFPFSQRRTSGSGL